MSEKPRVGRFAPRFRQLLLLVLLLGSVPACKGPGADEPGAAGAAPQSEPEAVPVKVVRPVIGAISRSIRTSSSLEAESEAHVYPQLGGLCGQVLAEEGDEVKTGDLLARLQDEEIRLACDQARARLEKARTDHERAEQLFADGLTSQQALHDASIQLRLAAADYELARKHLEDTSIVAPIAGLVTERNVKPGDLVGNGQPLFRIVALDSVRADVFVPEKDFSTILRGQTALLTADAYPGRTFESCVERLNPVIDAASGMAKVTITVRNPDRALRPGMFVRVEIVTDVHPEALLLPKAAIVLRGEQSFAYVVRDDVAREVAIETGFQDADRVEVLQGLVPEDRVVVAGQLGLQNETRVRVIDESQG
ncbi:MAG: efflux RND transporter periplasmic adaptor subunit [bacterium]